MNKKRNIKILVVIIILTIFLLMGGSYAFFSVIFNDTRNNENSSFTTDHLSNATIVSNIPNGVGSLTSTDIYPGHKEVLGLSVTGSGEVNSKSYFQFKYKVSENGLGSNVKISVYRSSTPIEITENHFNCIKKNESIEGSNDTKYFETCEEKDLGLLLEETILTGGQEDIVIGKDTITIKNENEDVTKYYYVVVEFLNKEESQNELMNRNLVGKVSVELTTPFERDYTNNIEATALSMNESYSNAETFSIHVTSEKYRLVSISEDNKSWEELEEKGKDITIEKTVTENGTYNYYFQDEAENIQEVTMEATKVDKDPPTLNVTAEEYLDGIKVDASKSSDSKSGIKTYSYKLNNGEYIESNENTHTFTGLSDGDYKVTVKLEDNAGNISEEKEMDVTIAYENVYISNSGNDESGNGSEIKPYASLQRAYHKVKSGGSMILLSNITATSTTNMNIENKSVTLKSNGSSVYSIERSSNFLSHLIVVENSNTLTTTNVILDGKSINANGSLIEARYSTLNLNEGTILQNNIHTGCYYKDWQSTNAAGSGVYMYTGNININGAIIQNNAVKSLDSAGGGIAIYFGTLNFNNGKISSNTSDKFGGGMFVGATVMVMKDGSIINNTGTHGGGIFLNSWGGDAIITMNGGTISNNIASVGGGGVYIGKDSYDAILYIKGGTISMNTAPTGSDTYASTGGQILN